MPPSDDTCLIRGATLWDGTGAAPVPDAALLVRNGRVAAVGPAESVAAATGGGAPPPPVRVVDAGGQWLLPGLIDMHVHLDEVLTPTAFPLFGVTSVRDCGSRWVTLQRLRARAARGEVGMPRLFWLGRNIDETTPSWSGAVAVAGPAEVPALIADMVRQGVDGVKLYVNARADVGCAVIAAAHRRHLPVTGHLDHLHPSEAAALGIDGLEHVFTLFSAELGHAAAANVMDMRKAYVAGASRTADPAGPAARRLIAALARRPLSLTATLTVSVMPLLDERAAEAIYAGWADVPAGWRQYWKDAYWSFLQPRGWTAVDYQRADRANARFRQMVHRLDQAGVPVIAGTDTPAPWVLPGAGLVHELDLLVGCGLSPRTVLLGATGRAAAALRKQGEVGTLTPGAHADFLLLDSSPLDDIRVLRRPTAVYLAGRKLDRAALRQTFNRVAAPPPQKPAS